MATSVPVPIAMPEVGLRQRGGVVHPVADHRDHRALACRSADLATLSAGSTSAMTSAGSIPTSAAIAVAAAALSPVSRIGRRPSPWSSEIACALVGFTVSATTSRPRAAPSQPTAMTVRPADSAAWRALLQLGVQGLCPLGRPARTPGRRRRRDRRPPRARPGPGWRRTTPPRAGRRPAPGRRRRRPRRPGARRRPPAHRPAASSSVSSVPARRDDVDQLHPAGGDGAGLVQHDGVDPAGGFQDLRALDQDAQLRAAAGADQQRGRGGQPEGAGAGDDQHRDGGGERGLGARAGAQPEPEGGDGEGDHDRHEHRGHPVGEPLHRGLPGLRRLDQSGHLRELGVGARSGWPGRPAGRRRSRWRR